MKNNKTISILTSFLLPFSLFIGLGFSKIIHTAQNDSPFCIIIGSIFGLIILFFLKKLPTKENKITTIIINIILLTLGILVLMKLISSIYLNKTNILIIIIPFILLLYYTSTKNNYTLLKTISILAIIYIIYLTISLLALIPTIEIDYFKPILINKPIKIITGSLQYTLYSITPYYALNNFKKDYNYKGYIISSIIILMIFIVIIGNLGLELSGYYRYPEYMLFKNISFLNFIENIENILFFIWIINIYTLSSHCCLKLKNILKNKGIIIILAIITIIINKYLINNYLSITIITKYFDYLLIALLFIYTLGKKINKH